MPLTIPEEDKLNFNITELTEGTIEGTGVFDVLMKAVKAHLKGEFDAGRIRATDYANVYSASVGQVLTEATQYALGRAKTKAELALLASQTELTKQQTVNLVADKQHAQEKHLLELQAIEVNIGKTTADTVLTTKQCLLVESQALTQAAQTSQIDAETRRVDYITSFQIPAEVAAITARTLVDTAQEKLVSRQILNSTAQQEQIIAQTADIKEGTLLKKLENDIQTFNKDFKLPQELLSMKKELELKDSQILLGNKELLVKQAQVDVATKEIALKQNQIDLGGKELLLKQAQVGIAEKEVLLKGEQLNVAKYELTTKLPAEVALTSSQSALYTQKTVTELAQVDSTPIKLNSVIDINNKLLEEQSKTFLRQGQQTAAKLLIDTWNVRHTADPDGNYADETNKLSDAYIAKAVTALLKGIEIPLV